MLTYETITATRGRGDKCEAVYVLWADIEDCLGRPHRGMHEDDHILIMALRAAGAPSWVSDADGWIDESGWGLFGPDREHE